jgi:stage V sporulation protein G
MEITEVKVFPIQEEKLRAFVSIVFDQCFMINDIKIIQGRDGLFISMPSRKKKNGEFKDVAHPLNNETRRMIEGKVLGEYERVLGERGEAVPAVTPLRPPVAAATAASGPGPSAASPPAAAPLAASSAAGAVAAGAAGPAASDSSAPEAEKTMEEIEELHLRDSFWTVT